MSLNPCLKIPTYLVDNMIWKQVIGQKYNECVVVLTSSGKISDMMAYTLGLRDSSELDQMVQQFANEEDVDVTLKEDDYSYQDILNKTFKLVKSADYYEYDEQYHVYKDKSNDQTYMNQLVQNGEDLKIVGIVQPKDDQTATMLSTGIYYPSSLVQHIIEKSSTTQIVQDQIKIKMWIFLQEMLLKKKIHNLI